MTATHWQHRSHIGDSYDLVNWIVGIVGTLRPSMEQLGIAVDVDLETLAARTTEEIVANASVVMRHLEVGAWCRVPSS